MSYAITQLIMHLISKIYNWQNS